jgi:hypothetical protein
MGGISKAYSKSVFRQEISPVSFTYWEEKRGTPLALKNSSSKLVLSVFSGGQDTPFPTGVSGEWHGRERGTSGCETWRD